MERVGTKVLAPERANSCKSDDIIDFGIVNDKDGWGTELLNEETSDHHPILFQLPYFITNETCFRKTSWNIFSFLLIALFDYWNSLEYNLNANSYYEKFSLFLTAVWDRYSVYERIEKHKTPCLPISSHSLRVK